VIIQSLDRCYERLACKPDADIPLRGFSRRPIHFCLIINSDGDLTQVADLRDQIGNKRVPKPMIVPEAAIKSVNITANFLWDNAGYVLGADLKGKPERAVKMFDAFKQLHHSIGNGLDDEGMQAVLLFLDSWQPENVHHLDCWDDIAAGGNLVFRLDGELQYVHERPKIREGWLAHLNARSSERLAYCLVSGEKRPISRLHPKIKGVWGAQSTGGSIVSFNLEAFQSFNKEQNYNAPISEAAAFNYATALNFLLDQGNRRKVQIGDATTVFWTERDSPIEGFMGIILDPRDDAADAKEVRDFLSAARDGKLPSGLENTEMKFFILGLSPNAGRLSVRFWYVSTVGEISQKIGQHFRDLSILKSYDNEPDFPGMWHLLRETAVQKDTKNISPLLGGALMRAILTGSAYPNSLLSAILTRIRADQNVNYFRAAIIKACLVRNYRLNQINKEVTMSLDKESKNIAYRLGRLFAALEKAQKDAVPGANTTIKDRYYGSASATPSIVFPQLLRLSQHHIQKAEYGGWTDKLVEEIMIEINKFPAHLNLDDQGLFAIGYYHQRQALYAKSTNSKED